MDRRTNNNFFLYTTLTDWFLLSKWTVFTARYGLNPYITQIRINFKGLRIAPDVLMNRNVSTKFYISLGISFKARILRGCFEKFSA